MTHTTNADIFPAARRGEFKDAGNFWTAPGAPSRMGYLPYRLQSILQERRYHISQVVYSYTTPIAWLDNGVWIEPDVTYSTTTSCKHQNQIYGAKRIPWDAGMDEYMQVINGKTQYVPNYRTKVGTYVAV